MNFRDLKLGQSLVIAAPEANYQFKDGQHWLKLRDGDKEIGKAIFRQEDGNLIAEYVEVEPEYKGKGLASKLYDLAEKKTGKRVIPSTTQFTFDQGITNFWVKRFKEQREGKDWFSQLPKEEKQAILKQHPNSTLTQPYYQKFGSSKEEYLKRMQERRLQEFKNNPDHRDNTVNNIVRSTDPEIRDLMEKSNDEQMGEGWFEALTPEQQKTYISNHPKSKYAKGKK